MSQEQTIPMLITLLVCSELGIIYMAGIEQKRKNREGERGVDEKTDS